MKFTLEIDCDNAAFDPSPGEEINRILSRLAECGEPFAAGDQAPLFDTNGNRVGHWKLAEDLK